MSRPVIEHEDVVRPEWIDSNGHMNLAYYTVLFDGSTDLLFDELGLGLDYLRDRLLGTFVAETHNLSERELLVGAGVRVATQILGADDKRLHLWHEMFALDGGHRCATQELMFLHVDLAVVVEVREHDPVGSRRLRRGSRAEGTVALSDQNREAGPEGGGYEVRRIAS